MKKAEQVISSNEFENVIGIVKNLTDLDTEKNELSFVGKGHNYVAYCMDTGKENLCIKFMVNENKDKFHNLIAALRICEENNILTNRVLYEDDSCKSIRFPFLITTMLDGEMLELQKLSDLNLTKCFREMGIYVAKLHNIHNSCFVGNLNTKAKIEIQKYIYERYSMLKEKMKQENEYSHIMDRIESIFLELYENIDYSKITPSFVHRDISEDNIIIWNQRFHGMIDFEHACFFDCIWDFAKLSINMLNEGELSWRDHFFCAYNEVKPLAEEPCKKQRFQIYYLLELMWAIVNDYRNQKSKYLQMFYKFINCYCCKGANG